MGFFVRFQPMAKTHAEFQTIEEITATAKALKDLADQAAALVRSFNAVELGGAKIVGHKAKNDGLDAIQSWIKSGFGKVNERVRQNEDFGIPAPDLPDVHEITANNRKRKKQPGSSGKKV